MVPDGACSFAHGPLLHCHASSFTECLLMMSIALLMYWGPKCIVGVQGGVWVCCILLHAVPSFSFALCRFFDYVEQDTSKSLCSGMLGMRREEWNGFGRLRHDASIAGVQGGVGACCILLHAVPSLPFALCRLIIALRRRVGGSGSRTRWRR